MSRPHSERVTRPALSEWRNWTYRDYLAFFLSRPAMHARLQGEVAPAARIAPEDLAEFCRPIRERFQPLFGGANPRVSIVLPAYNEQVELLPTLLALTRLRAEPGLAEVVVADNNSTDQTAGIIQSCGAKYTLCTTKGVGYCRRAAYEAISPSSEYIWLTDADMRVIPPLVYPADFDRQSTLLETCCRFLDENPNMLGLSTGALPEGGHWLYRSIRAIRVKLGLSRRYSCWAGYNQFVRRWALNEIGGIDPTVEFGDDHHRHSQLARLGKKLHQGLSSANMNAALADPVYYSGRRYATLGLLMRHYREAFFRPKLRRDEFGFPIHDKGIGWRQIRMEKQS